MEVPEPVWTVTAKELAFRHDPVEDRASLLQPLPAHITHLEAT